MGENMDITKTGLMLYGCHQRLGICILTTGLGSELAIPCRRQGPGETTLQQTARRAMQIDSGITPASYEVCLDLKTFVVESEQQNTYYTVAWHHDMLTKKTSHIVMETYDGWQQTAQQK